MGDINYGKAEATLGLFLLTGSLIISTGCIVAGVLTYFTTGAAAPIIYFVFVTGLFSLYPTPILVLTFLKPVRDKLKTCLPCWCLYGHHLSVAGSTTRLDKAISSANTSSRVILSSKWNVCLCVYSIHIIFCWTVYTVAVLNFIELEHQHNAACSRVHVLFDC